MLGSSDEAIPILNDVFRWPADLGNNVGNIFGLHHLDGIPRANREFVGVRLLLWDVDTDFTPDAFFEIDLAPSLVSLDSMIKRFEFNAVHRAYFQARFAPGAVVRIDHCEFFGDFFSGTFFGHTSPT